MPPHQIARHLRPDQVHTFGEKGGIVDQAAFDDESISLEMGDFIIVQIRRAGEVNRILKRSRFGGRKLIRDRQGRRMTFVIISAAFC